ncbi:polysaccharide deacetylase family protein [Porphyromonas pogonae]|uniref:polysaccharide deacetylase family protein n=1 Tax=Porphyromonas pogonae TaxID=867595 RepID=UPI002E76BB44|nr:polysaccharide deacetylase family protein [Porphyromonas pogonae]
MVLLSFDTEEFDVPLEHSVDLSMPEQMKISGIGLGRILDVLEKEKVTATFFCTANFASNSPDLMQRIVSGGHEVASHGYYHSYFEVQHLRESKEKLEEITGKPVTGYRQARMMPVDENEICAAGYTYNSSINPTFIPGRYMNFREKCTPYLKSGVWQIPVSVVPYVRFPLFWLSCHNLPMSLYLSLCKYAYRHYGYYTVYFHPWEFVDLNKNPEWKLPFIVRHNSGEPMCKKLAQIIGAFKQENAVFGTYSEFIREMK